MRLGIDVGGTNTDAVLVQGKNVLASTKQSTSEDIASGIVAAINEVIQQANVGHDDIEAVMIGTTQFTNAFVERKCLDKVAVIRLCLPASQSLPPLADWPEDLTQAIHAQCYMTAGGYEFDGREISPLDTKDLERIAKDLKKNNISSAAISSVFAPVRGAMEEEAAKILKKFHPDLSLTLSKDIGRVGLLERENAAIMNASLASHAKKVVQSFHDALQTLGIKAPFYLTQNDGTLMQAEQVAKFPILTFSSGPTNSMRGAAWLSGIDSGLVIDIGGTTSDIGALRNGYPRESSVSVNIGGVRTNFRMPDVFAIGVGGGSLVDDAGNVGPKSVGSKLLQDAKIFGGEQLTASDIAVAAGRVSFGDPELLKALPSEQVAAALESIQQQIEDGLDQMKTEAGDQPVILVGGGSVLLGDSLRGAKEIIKPPHFAVANAIGAAIAQIGGEVDRVYAYADIPREEAIEQASQIAQKIAIDAGANPDTVEIIDIEEVPLAYLPNGAVRLRVKAVGDLAEAQQ